MLDIRHKVPVIDGDYGPSASFLFSLQDSEPADELWCQFCQLSGELPLIFLITPSLKAQDEIKENVIHQFYALIMNSLHCSVILTL